MNLCFLLNWIETNQQKPLSKIDLDSIIFNHTEYLTVFLQALNLFKYVHYMSIGDIRFRCFFVNAMSTFVGYLMPKPLW